MKQSMVTAVSAYVCNINRMRNKCMKSLRQGFTLIELLVVVAIIALLVSILMPSLKRAKELARRTVCASNLHTIGISIHLYASDMPELPSVKGTQYCYYWFYFPGTGFMNIGLLAKAEYLPPQSDIFICPTDTSGYFQNSHGASSHINCVSEDELLPEDKDIGWTHMRSYYRRGNNADDELIATITDLGSKAWLADCFSQYGHVSQRHGDGVNVWYGDGHVKYNVMDKATSEALTELWNTFGINGDYKEFWAAFDE